MWTLGPPLKTGIAPSSAGMRRLASPSMPVAATPLSAAVVAMHAGASTEAVLVSLLEVLDVARCACLSPSEQRLPLQPEMPISGIMSLPPHASQVSVTERLSGDGTGCCSTSPKSARLGGDQIVLVAECKAICGWA